GDHADVAYTTDEPLYPSGDETTIHAVAVDPKDSRHVVIALSSTEPGPPGSHPEGHTALFASTDRGRSWTKASELAVGRVCAIRIEDDGVVRVAAEDGAWEGRGATWQRRTRPGAEPLASASYGRDGSAGRTLLYATDGAGIAVSEDGGGTWRRSNG